MSTSPSVCVRSSFSQLLRSVFLFLSTPPPVCQLRLQYCHVSCSWSCFVAWRKTFWQSCFNKIKGLHGNWSTSNQYKARHLKISQMPCKHRQDYFLTFLLHRLSEYLSSGQYSDVEKFNTVMFSLILNSFLHPLKTIFSCSWSTVCFFAYTWRTDMLCKIPPSASFLQNRRNITSALNAFYTLPSIFQNFYFQSNRTIHDLFSPYILAAKVSAFFLTCDSTSSFSFKFCSSSLFKLSTVVRKSLLSNIVSINCPLS